MFWLMPIDSSAVAITNTTSAQHSHLSRAADDDMEPTSQLLLPLPERSTRASL